MSEIEETVLEPVKSDEVNLDDQSQKDINIILETGVVKQETPPHRDEFITTQSRYVLGFAFSSDKKEVLLITKNRPQWQAGLLNGIGGKIEESDQNPAYAMEREFREETGLFISHQQWQPFAIMESPHFKLHAYWTISDILEQHVSITDELVSLEKIEHLYNNQFSSCISNVSWLIGMILDRDISNLNCHINYLG